MPFYYDKIYWILLGPVLLLSIYAQIKVSASFRRYSRVRNQYGYTGAQAAQMVLRDNGIFDVAICPCQGELTDHYDPRDNTIYLSERGTRCSMPSGTAPSASARRSFRLRSSGPSSRLSR